MDKLKDYLFQGLTDNEEELKLNGAAPPDYVDAVNSKVKTIKELNATFKDKIKEAEDFVKDQEKENNVIKNKDMKKMHLSESLFEDNSNVKQDVHNLVNNLLDSTLDNLSQVVAQKIKDYNPDWCDSDGQSAVSNQLVQKLDQLTDSIVAVLFANNNELSEAIEYDNAERMGQAACAPIVHDYTDDIERTLREIQKRGPKDWITDTLVRWAEQLKDKKQEVKNFNTYWLNRYAASINFINAQLELIPSEYLNESLQEDVVDEKAFRKDINIKLKQLESNICDILNTCNPDINQNFKKVQNSIIDNKLVVKYQIGSFTSFATHDLITSTKSGNESHFPEVNNGYKRALNEIKSLLDKNNIVYENITYDYTHIPVGRDYAQATRCYLYITFNITKDSSNESITEATAVLDRPETDDIEVDFRKPQSDTLYYKTKRQPLADILMRELTSGEVVYKMGDKGKLNATHAPSLNLEEDDIGANSDSKGEYIIAWLSDEATTKKVEEIAQRYHRPSESGYSKYAVGDKKYFTKIYIDPEHWDEPYVDPDVQVRPSGRKKTFTVEQ